MERQDTHLIIFDHRSKLSFSNKPTSQNIKVKLKITIPAYVH